MAATLKKGVDNMNASETVKRLFEQEGRSNVLATSDRSGRVNIAAFGSIGITEDSAIMVMLGENRSYVNLKQNPYAACLITIPGKTGIAQEGCRLYLKARSMEDAGEDWNRAKEEIRAHIGNAADLLKHLVLFDIVEARPILDFGQGI